MLRRVPSDPIPFRTPESRTLWVLNGLPHTIARELEQWLDAVGELPLEEWVRIGERFASHEHGFVTTTRACRRVAKAIDQQKLEVTAWLVRDLVETATYHVQREMARRPRRVRAQLAVARMAAEWAALAIACQAPLQSAEREVLCAPFGEPSPRRGSATA